MRRPLDLRNLTGHWQADVARVSMDFFVNEILLKVKFSPKSNLGFVCD